MNRIRWISTSSLAALALSFVSFANAQEERATLRPQADEVEVKVENRRITNIINSKVLLQGDEAAGKAVDLIISDSGCIEYIVASHNDQYYYIPYTVAQVRAPQHVVYLDVTPTQFREVQFFRGNAWPAITPTYRQTVFQTFGVSVNVNDNDGRGRNRAGRPNRNDAAPRSGSDRSDSDAPKDRPATNKPEKKPADNNPPAAKDQVNPDSPKPAPRANGEAAPRTEKPAPKTGPNAPRTETPSTTNPEPRPKAGAQGGNSAPSVDPGTIDPPGPAPKPEKN